MLLVEHFSRRGNGCGKEDGAGGCPAGYRICHRAALSGYRLPFFFEAFPGWACFSRWLVLHANHCENGLGAGYMKDLVFFRPGGARIPSPIAQGQAREKKTMEYNRSVSKRYTGTTMKGVWYGQGEKTDYTQKTAERARRVPDCFG
jgi:hypothetical protein